MRRARRARGVQRPIAGSLGVHERRSARGARGSAGRGAAAGAAVKHVCLGLDVGRGKEKVALVRLRLAKALIGAAEANAVAAESIAIQRGVSTEEIAHSR